jgi:ArsR family transcriptional regulator
MLVVMPTALPLLAHDLAACCTSPTGGGMGMPTAQRLSTLLKVIADPTRLRLLSLLAAEDHGEACICNLTEPVGLSQPTVSHHMKVLVDAGLLERDQRGKWAYYRLIPGALDAVGELVTLIARSP